MQKGTKFTFAAAVFFLSGTVSTVFGATYYVATNGNNNNPGTFELPWLTILKAAQTMVAGDTTYIRGNINDGHNGIYNVTSSITPVNSGSAAGGYITFSAYQNEVPIIDGGGLAFRVFTLTSAHSYFRWFGLTIRNMGTGTQVAGGIGIVRDISPSLGAYPHHFEILNCTMDDCTSSCIKVHGVHDIIFAGNTFLNSKQGIELAVVDRENDYNIQIMDCYFYNMSWEGVVAKAVHNSDYDPVYWCEDVYITGCESADCDDDGFDLFGRYFTIEHSIAHDIHSTSDGHGFKIYALDVPADAGRYHADFNRCLVYNSAHDGYKFSSLMFEESNDYVKKYRMRNCTSANNVNSISLVTNITHPMDVLIKNSILSGTNLAWEITAGTLSTWSLPPESPMGPTPITSYLTLDSDYNLWYAGANSPINYLGTNYSLAGWRSFSTQDGNSISVNPTFDANYHPGNSACIDSGTDVGLPYAGDAPDRGFYESGTVEVNCPATYLTTGENWISIPISAINDGPYSVFKDLGTWPNSVYHNLYRYDSQTVGLVKYPTYQSDTLQFGKIIPGNAYKLMLGGNQTSLKVPGIELSETQTLTIGGTGTRYFYFGDPFNKSLYRSNCRIKNGSNEVSLNEAVSNGWVSNPEHFNPTSKSWESAGNIFSPWHAYRLQALTSGELQLVIYYPVAGDLDNDGDVDFDDLWVMSGNWLDNDCGSIPVGNLDSDCDVDFKDYAILAGNWLAGT